jgi:hypothetical protein
MQRFLERAVLGLAPVALMVLVLALPAAADPDANHSTAGLTSPILWR